MKEAIRLSWPAWCMWPNSRVDRRSASGVRKRYRQEAFWATHQACFRNLSRERVHLVVTFCPPDARKRDLDNMLAAIKSGLDGIADAIEVDDSRWEISLVRGETERPHGAVYVQIGSQIARGFVPFRGEVS